MVDGTIQIKITDKWEILSDLKNLQEDVPEYKALKAYDYYVTMIQFISDLCLERNFIAINKIIERLDDDNHDDNDNITLFPLDICYKIITSSEFDFKLRSVFAKLFLNSWVDGQILEKLDFPNNLRIWKDIPD